jgi:hypothetical protein
MVGAPVHIHASDVSAMTIVGVLVVEQLLLEFGDSFPQVFDFIGWGEPMTKALVLLCLSGENIRLRRRFEPIVVGPTHQTSIW